MNCWSRSLLSVRRKDRTQATSCNCRFQREVPSSYWRHVNSTAYLPRIALALVVTAGCSKGKDRTGPAPASVFDISADVMPFLRQRPHVAGVERYGPNQPAHRIIHIADWHFVEKKAFAADLGSSDDEIDALYEQHFDDVAAIQDQQIELLRALIRAGLKIIHIEGLAVGDEFIFKAKIKALRRAGDELAALLEEKANLLALEPDSETRAIIEQIEAVEAEHRRNLLRLGAAGKLALNGEIEVLPLEDAEAFAASNPVAGETVIFDQLAIEAREDAQVRILLAEPVAVIILGGDHDLSDNLDARAEYIRVEVEVWKEISGDGRDFP